MRSSRDIAHRLVSARGPGQPQGDRILLANAAPIMIKARIPQRPNVPSETHE